MERAGSRLVLIPMPTAEETRLAKEQVEEAAAKTELPPIPEHPLADRVEELQLMKAVDEDPDFYEELKKKSHASYCRMKETPDAVAKKYCPDLCRRFIDFELRIKKIEDRLWKLPREDGSLEEGRFEILGELLDKACNELEIWDEHLEKKIPWGHRLALEGRLFSLLHEKFDIIEQICDEFGKLKDDRHGVNNEREWLRYEIRSCDIAFYEINEHFLLSYLDMPW